MFKVGDLVTGISSEHYVDTTEDAVMKVLSTNGHGIHVVVLSHRNPLKQRCVGMRYDVLGKHFKLAKPAFKGNVK